MKCKVKKEMNRVGLHNLGPFFSLLMGLVMLVATGCAWSPGGAEELPTESENGTLRTAAFLAMDAPPAKLAVLGVDNEKGYLSQETGILEAPDGEALLVAGADGYLSWVGTSIGGVGSRKRVCEGPALMAGGALRERLLLACPEEGQIKVVDPMSLDVVDSMRVCSHPVGIATDPGGHRVYVRCEGMSGVMLLIDEQAPGAPRQDAVIMTRSALEGRTRMLSLDGFLRWVSEDAPPAAGGWALAAEGQTLISSFRKIVYGGALEINGDGDVQVELGLVFLNAETGQATSVHLEEWLSDEEAISLGEPSWVTSNQEGTAVAVSLDGRGMVLMARFGVKNTSPGGIAQLQVSKLVLEGKPSALVISQKSPETLYVLDASRNVLIKTNIKLEVISQTALSR